MKTFDKKDVFTLVTAEEAKEYLGKDGYFGDSFADLKHDLSMNEKYKLEHVSFDDDAQCIYCRERGTYYSLFLPADKVKEVKEEKKWRAFNNHEELAKTLGIETKSLIGTKITWRNKGNGITVGQALIINVFSNKEESCITLGLVNYSMEKLFYELELNKDGEWQPFGVQE